jgi:cytochrome c-type biogenesis protein
MNQPDLLAALAAGLVSFISPCVLPLLPAYLSILSGLTVKELAGREQKAKLLGTSLMFSAGFTLAFTVLGIVFAGGMNFIGGGSSRLFGQIAGAAVILLGFNLVFDFIRILNNDVRLIQKFAGKGRGHVNAFLMGLAFAAGWSPCIGPILASILLMAAKKTNVGASAMLLVAYSAGFALPFVASALFFERLSPLLAFLKKHGNGVRIASGVLLIGFGLAMLLGSVSRISAMAAQTGAILLNLTSSSPVATRLIGAAIWLLLALLPTRRILRAHKAAQAKVGAHNRQLDSNAPKSGTACILLGIFTILALLELFGALSLLKLLGSWLTFSGL